MKIEPIFTSKNGKDGYKFKVNDAVILEIANSAISVLKINIPLSGYIEEYYKSIREQFDIEKMTNDLLNKNTKLSRIIIDSEVCRTDGKIVFQTSDLGKYKI